MLRSLCHRSMEAFMSRSLTVSSASATSVPHSSRHFHRPISTGAGSVLFTEAEGHQSPPQPKDKVLKLKLSSTRLDIVLKAGLGIARSKVEKIFYEDRIRVNGVRPKKKSVTTDEGDEIDVVRGPNKVNPLFLDVNRVEILEVKEKGSKGEEGSDYESDDEGDEGGEKIPVILKRYKNLTVENYPTPWKGNAATD